MIKLKRVGRICLWVLWGLIALPVFLFLFLSVLLYVPAVQDFALHKATEALSSSMNLDVKADRVRLSFPLDLAIDKVVATENKDTLLDAGTIRLSVAVMPLFRAQACINGVEILDAKVNTLEWVGGAHIKGEVGTLKLPIMPIPEEGFTSLKDSLPNAGDGVSVAWETQRVRVGAAVLRDANLLVCLSDTALDDTTKTKKPWVIDVQGVRLKNVKAKVALAAAVPPITIDSVRPEQMWIAAEVGDAKLQNGHFDTGRADYSFHGFKLTEGNIAYKAKGQDGLWTQRAQMPPIPEDKERTSIDSLRNHWDYRDNLDGLLRWQPFAQPASGSLDTDNIVLTDCNLQIDGLSYDKEGRLKLNLKDASLKEKNSGFEVNNLIGEVYLDNERVRLPKIQLKTPYTTVNIGGDIPWSALSEGFGSLSFNVDAVIGWQDVVKAAKGYVDAKLLKLYPHYPLTVKGLFSGNLKHLSFKDAFLSMPDLFSAKATGRMDNIETNPMGNVNFALITGSRLPALYKQMLPDVAQTVALPSRVTAKGNVTFSSDDYTFNTEIGTGGGSALAQGKVNTRTENFSLSLKSRNFPVRSFLPSYEITPFTGNITARGNTFDVLSPRADVHLTADVKQLSYAGYDLRGIDLQAQLKQGKAVANFEANNPNIVGRGTLEAALGKKDYQGVLDANFKKLDLKGLGMMEDTLTAMVGLNVNFNVSSDFKQISTDGHIANICLQTNQRGFMTDDLNFAFSTANDTTWATAESGDLVLRFGTKGDLDKLLPRLNSLVNEAMRQVERRELDQEALRREFPVMNLYLSAGQNNPISDYLRYQGYTFRTLFVDLHAHPSNGLSGKTNVGALRTGNLLLDTINLTLYQDTTGVQFNGFIKNYTKKNPTKFDARLKGYVLSKGVGLETVFYDNEGEKSIDLGVRADIVDNGINIVLYPENPVLAYRNFTINRDNYIYLGNDKKIRADVDLLADDGTGLKIYSTATDDTNDITVSVNNINLTELSSVLPYLPQMGGMLSGDFHIYDNHENISAMGSLLADNFTYQGNQLGNIGADVIYLPKDEGEHYASAYISSAGQEVMEAEGTYYTKGEGTFEGNAHLHDFPLPLINAFLDGTDIALSGKGEGDISISGALSSPNLNGELKLDSANIYSDVYGFNFRMDEKPIVFQNSRIIFDKYNLYSTGTNPLVVDGNLDLSNLSKMRVDLGLTAHDFELINTKKTQKSMLFGKLMTNFDGTIKGTLENLSIRGKLDVLDKTDMTYILKDSPLSVDNRLDDLVTFVSFTDSVEVDEEEPETPMNFDMALNINVSEASHFHCFLSEDGQSYVDIDGGGNLMFRITQQGDMRLTGKLTAKGGKMKYEMPVIPLRTFTIKEGSTIEFTGVPMNPTLNVQATERMKVLVTENEQQRAVAFDVGVAISKPLDQMALEFTIDAPEDLGVQTQLSSMTKEQRYKAAVAMMATGMFITDTGAMTSGFKANNVLNAFLQNEIQNIAGNALKTVDLSVGVETGTSLTGTQTTDYSFQFAKRFWNDKIRVIIGGRVSAGKNADNRAQSIINNVSVEYTMNSGATRYLRVFYNRDQQDPLEGLLTETGVGYSFRKKTDHFGDLFIFWRKQKKEEGSSLLPQEKTDSVAGGNNVLQK